jgi:hypothetical protein
MREFTKLDFVASKRLNAQITVGVPKPEFDGITYFNGP